MRNSFSLCVCLWTALGCASRGDPRATVGAAEPSCALRDLASCELFCTEASTVSDQAASAPWSCLSWCAGTGCQEAFLSIEACMETALDENRAWRFEEANAQWSVCKPQCRALFHGPRAERFCEQPAELELASGRVPAVAPSRPDRVESRAERIVEAAARRHSHAEDGPPCNVLVSLRFDDEGRVEHAQTQTDACCGSCGVRDLSGLHMLPAAVAAEVRRIEMRVRVDPPGQMIPCESH